MSDGQRKQQNGIQVSAPSTRQTEQWDDQKKRWEDEINDFLKPEETEETKSCEKTKKTTTPGSKVAKDRERWKAMETDDAVAAASIH